MAGVITVAEAGSAADWRVAVLRSAELLSERGATTPAYGPRCVESLEQSGPYVVLTKGLALAHARPDDSCLAAGLSLLRLADAVAFGHPTNDPVDLVFCLASPDAQAHIAALKQFATGIRGGLLQQLRDADPAELTSLVVRAVGDE